MKTLYAEDLSFSYVNNGKKLSWQNFNFSVSQGEAISIIGSSGIGKTTLLRVLSGLHKYEKGCVYIDKKENIVRQPSSPIFIVFQEYNLTLLPWLTIKENINLGVFKSKEPKKAGIDEILNLLFPKIENYQEFIEKYPDQLSGGQKQRIQIARALVSDAEFIFFDEPDTGIDYKNKISLRKILQNLVKAQQKGVVLITHDLENAYEFSDRVYIIHKSFDDNIIHIEEFRTKAFTSLADFKTRILQIYET